MATELPSDAELRARLAPMQYQVTQQKRTEPPLKAALEFDRGKQP